MMCICKKIHLNNQTCSCHYTSINIHNYITCTYLHKNVYHPLVDILPYIHIHSFLQCFDSHIHIHHYWCYIHWYLYTYYRYYLHYNHTINGWPIHVLLSACNWYPLVQEQMYFPSSQWMFVQLWLQPSISCSHSSISTNEILNINTRAEMNGVFSYMNIWFV